MAIGGAGAPVIYLDQPQGAKLLSEVQNGGAGIYQPILHNIFTQQTSHAGCGIQSCALALCANALGTRRQSLNAEVSSVDVPNTELGLYEMPQTLKVTNRIAVAKAGLTLAQVSAILRSHGCIVRTVYATSASSADFRNDVLVALSSVNSQSGLIVNFHRSMLNTGNEPSRKSHHSPLVAYHRTADCVLVLDTAAPLGRHFWVSVDSMFAAMSTGDRVSGQSRGYCVFSKG